MEVLARREVRSGDRRNPSELVGGQESSGARPTAQAAHGSIPRATGETRETRETTRRHRSLNLKGKLAAWGPEGRRFKSSRPDHLPCAARALCDGTSAASASPPQPCSRPWRANSRSVGRSAASRRGPAWTSGPGVRRSLSPAVLLLGHHNFPTNERGRRHPPHPRTRRTDSPDGQIVRLALLRVQPPPHVDGQRRGGDRHHLQERGGRSARRPVLPVGGVRGRWKPLRGGSRSDR